MAAVAARYGDDIDQLDVLNENLQFGNGGEHAPATGVFRQALGGNGASGYDWVIWLFSRARRYFPNSKLILNDYGLENDQSATNRQLAVVRVLRDRNLIDGFGTQAHEFNVNTLSATQLRNALDLMDNSGVPTYVTELDISGTDQEQQQRYQTLFPEYWNHPSVAGITLWGYIEGQTWIANTGLVSTGNNNPTESPAMQSIKTFISGRSNVNYPFVTSSDEYSLLEKLTAYPNPFDEAITINHKDPFKYQVFNVMGKLELSGASTGSITFGETLSSGLYMLVIERDAQKEYVKITKK
jgi:Glycosyl hydrolase family 10/Secretion system C-terminal sorting domain